MSKKKGTYHQNMEFEAEVRRAAEAVWQQEPGSCQPSHYSDVPGVNEVDGVIRLRDVTHLVMATTSTKLAKAKADVAKLLAAEKVERKRAQSVSKWFITQKQLDAEHVTYADKHNVTALTLDDFRRRFFDGLSYLAKRANAPFGSARNPHDNSINFDSNAYVPLPIRFKEISANPARKKRQADDGDTLTSLSNLLKSLYKEAYIVLVAPFGGGKSLTTREAFNSLASAYRSGASTLVPVALNLREHWGQEYGDEILERHARSIGYSPKEDLVIAWRAGMVVLLLDGFDEIAAQSVIRTDDKNFMRDARSRALTGVRDLVSKAPSGVGVWICGRDHYFDNIRELTHSLGLTGVGFQLARLDEFSEEAAKEFLKRNGVKESLPDWLPRKPLLLSYLLRHELLDALTTIDPTLGFGYCWDNFLTRIAEREAALERAAMEPETLRAVMENLAFTVRSRQHATGPITGSDLSEAYSAETGQAATEGVLVHLQRLPGLTQREADPGIRSFVDEDMLSALQGGAFTRLVLEHHSKYDVVPIAPLDGKAMAMAAYLLDRSGSTSETVISVMHQANQKGQHSVWLEQFLSDCLSIVLTMAESEDRTNIDFHGLVISNAMIGRIDLEDFTVSGVEFRNSVIDEVVLGSASRQSSVRFNSCLIVKLSGAANPKGLPTAMFAEDCEIEEFDNLSTTSAVLSTDLSPQVKALVTVLRKLYKQAGSGRKVSALSRGIGQEDIAGHIPEVLGILESEGLATRFNKIVHPVRKNTSRVERILSAPGLAEDPIIDAVSKL
jgi:hypothetical protein